MRKLLLITAVSLTVLSCGNNKKDKETSSINIDGSSTVYPVTEAIAEEYRSEDPDVDVTIGVSGTGGGFKKFGRGETDISNASRPIKEDEKKIAEQNNIDFIELEVAYDGLAVVVNPENDWVDCFTVEQLKKIWEPGAQGTITHWNQINPEWPNEEIHLFGPGVASGTFDYFTEAIVGESGSSRGDYTASEDDNVLVQGVSGDKYGLGFFGLAYYEENEDKLRMVAVDGGEGCVEPSTQTVSDGSYAPLSRPLFVYVNSSSIQNNPKVVDFMNFYLNEAPSLLKDVGYVPLTPEEYKEQKEKFKSFVEKHQNNQK
ncbi:phosphate ABC transporter substrate-binding protein, PhoT family [Salinimicrobium catena]|uniref:Phosphate-binding protein n=1 Tax=Salinimicrobium catena TaxID=390640 RepID=A0A1H5NX17_9FLAO|nr:PstS family phosphate ABC transporter substrate-binding protein [Salinimicrobium catena]SDL61394.1 phosphate ABC transporter substrate-binding protein, PhoT family (TC 3.A.1.7.1) [Salinimicrobium catena]SEF05248.1 phosphate ABC transporter substrate-binding protein, PhoT family [Salinimicrobium catena]